MVGVAKGLGTAVVVSAVQDGFPIVAVACLLSLRLAAPLVANNAGADNAIFSVHDMEEDAALDGWLIVSYH